MKTARRWRNLVVAGMALAVVMAGAAQSARAGWTYVNKTVRVPYTYYVWETQTRYRTVMRPVEHVVYREEVRAYTTYEEDGRFGVRSYFDSGGNWSIGLSLRPAKVAVTRYRTVRVPVVTTRYEEVREPYTVRVRVQKTGYREVIERVRVWQPAPAPAPTRPTAARDRGSSSRTTRRR